MQKKVLALIVTMAGVALLIATAGFAEVPAPPANQILAVDDSIFNSLSEADCRVCHGNPDIVGPTSNVDRHHLKYGQALPQGECSINRNPCLSDADCDAAICSSTGAPCTIDTNCPEYGVGETCGEVCVGETAVPNLDADGDGSDDTTYICLSCHDQDTSGGVISFLVERNCLECHVQVPGEGSVHHLTATAQGIDSPLGDPDIGDCTPCHGSFVDDIGDGHTIPTYTPSLVTPKPSGGDALPLNSRGKGAGACDYCHDSGTDTPSGVQVYTNADTHHNTGLFFSETGVPNNAACLWCHNLSLPEAYEIRVCERCHGYESLHNIQADSDGSGDIIVGGELRGYGHIGADDADTGSDCWGCHGFTAADAAPSSAIIIPYINSADVSTMPAGNNTQLTLSGAALTNIAYGWQVKSKVVLTAEDGTVTELTPTTISENTLTVTIPGTMPVGNYAVRAVKYNVASNPVAISIKPAVVISGVTCKKCQGIITITGSGFGDTPPQGTQDYLNVEEQGVQLDIISWTDSEIKASGTSCSGSVTVNALYGSATWQ